MKDFGRFGRFGFGRFEIVGTVFTFFKLNLQTIILSTSQPFMAQMLNFLGTLLK
jgi:hypothetical protein